MKPNCLVAAIFFILFSKSIGAEPVITAYHNDKVTAPISVYRTSPLNIIWSLDLRHFKDIESGITLFWIENEGEPLGYNGLMKLPDPWLPSHPYIPPIKIRLSGIDYMLPCNGKHAIIANGTTTATNALREYLRFIDKEQKQIQIEVTVLNLSIEDQKKLGLDAESIFEWDKSHTDKCIESLINNGAKPINSSITNIITGVGSMRVNPSMLLMSVFARANADNTYTIIVLNSKSDGRHYFQYRMANSETIVFSEYVNEPDPILKPYFIFLTLKV